MSKQKLPKHIIAFEEPTLESDNNIILKNKLTGGCVYASKDEYGLTSAVDDLNNGIGFGFNYAVREGIVGKQIVF